MSVKLNILYLICKNCIEFDSDPRVLLNFHPKYSKIRTISNIWLVQTKLNMTTLCLDNHCQSFCQLISRSVQCVLASLSPGVNQKLLQLISV